MAIRAREEIVSTDTMQTAWRAPAGPSRREPLRAAPDYSLWSLEELRAFAVQMQLPGAAGKSRRELLEIFVPSPPRSSSAA